METADHKVTPNRLRTLAGEFNQFGVMQQDNFYQPGPTEKTVRSPSGQVLAVPDGWQLLPPGDAALTRRVKAAGDHWVVRQRRGRKVFSLGVWAPGDTIDRIRGELEAERSTDAYARRLAAGQRHREKLQTEYVEDFTAAILAFLDFAPAYLRLAEQLAAAVAEHATPVGSGTVARTKQIPIEARAEAAVIAWLRHATTGYDDMKIPRIAGQRRAVRRQLAQRSRELLERYRRGDTLSPHCPLQKALSRGNEK